MLFALPAVLAAGHEQVTVSDNAEAHYSHFRGSLDSRGRSPAPLRLFSSNEPSPLLHHPLAISFGFDDIPV